MLDRAAAEDRRGSAAAGEVTSFRIVGTQGNAPQAHKDLVATFNRVGLKPGEYVWASAVPAEGDPRIVVDLLTQMAYAYRGDRLVGAATISSAKKAW